MSTAPRSLGYAKNLHEGKYRVEETRTSIRRKTVFIWKSTAATKNTRESKEGDIPPNVFDILSSFYYVRGMPLEVGRTDFN